MKRAVGRPQEYDASFVKKAQKYLDECVDGYRRVMKSKGKRSVMYAHEKVIKLPNMGGLAVYLGIARATIYDWARKYPEFSDIIERIQAEQENRLINGGISSEYNPTISKVLLTKHGYREGHEVANPDGSNAFRPSTEEQAAAAKALKDM